MADVKKSLIRLFLAFPVTGQDDKSALAVYWDVLQGIDEDAVCRALDKFCRGEVEDHDGKYRPPAPMVAKVARSIAHNPYLSPKFARIWSGPSNWIEDKPRAKIEPPKGELVKVKNVPFALDEVNENAG